MAEPTTGPAIDLSERVTLWLARAGSVGLAIMMFLTLADVIGRTFNHPISGTVEVTELIMGMMIYLGIGYTTFYRGHIRVDILLTILPARVQAFLDLLTGTIGLVFMGVISWRLFLNAQSRVSNGDLTQIWEFPVWPAAYIMAFASVLMVTSLLLHLVLTARSVTTGVPYSVGSEKPAPSAH